MEDGPQVPRDGDQAPGSNRGENYADHGRERSEQPPIELPVARDSQVERPVPSWLDTIVQYTWRGLILLLGVGVVFAIVSRISLVALPVIIALILATMAAPPARRLERRGVPRMAAALIVVVGGIGVFAGVIALLAPSFITQIRELGPTVVEGADSVLTWLEEGPIGYDRSQVDRLIDQGVGSLEDSAGEIAISVGAIALAIGQALTALVLAVVLLFFFVKDGDQLVRWFIARVPAAHRDTLRATGTRGWVALSGFVRGTAAVALIDAAGIGIGLLIVDVPLVLPLSVLVFFGAFIPVIGALVTGLLAALVALASSGPVTALIVVGIVVVVQQVESNVLQPTIMRRAVALHPTVVLAVLTMGAVLIGIVGAFLAVPVTAVLAAVGNELRLRHELAHHGGVAGPEPIGGHGVDPETISVRFPADTRISAARRLRAERSPRRRIRRRTRITEDGEIEVTEVFDDTAVENTQHESQDVRRAAGDATRPEATTDGGDARRMPDTGGGRDDHHGVAGPRD